VSLGAPEKGRVRLQPQLCTAFCQLLQQRCGAWEGAWGEALGRGPGALPACQAQTHQSTGWAMAGVLSGQNHSVTACHSCSLMVTHSHSLSLMGTHGHSHSCQDN